MKLLVNFTAFVNKACSFDHDVIFTTFKHISHSDSQVFNLVHPEQHHVGKRALLPYTLFYISLDWDQLRRQDCDSESTLP